jgi:hypothetical protein
MRQLKSILWTASIGAVVVGAIGCQQRAAVPMGGLNDPPPVADQAMELRDWDRLTAHYMNPRFVAGNPGFLFQPADDLAWWAYPLIETPMFLGQTLALPVTLILRPPTTPVQYAGEMLPPTYHAMPPLPPSEPGTAQAMENHPMRIHGYPAPPPPDPDPMAPGIYPPEEPIIPQGAPTLGLERDPTQPPEPVPPEQVMPPAPEQGPMGPRGQAPPNAAGRELPPPPAEDPNQALPNEPMRIVPAPGPTPAAVPVPPPANRDNPRATQPATQPTTPQYVPSRVAPTGPATAPARDANKD